MFTDEGCGAAEGSTALRNCCVSLFFTLYAERCHPHCYRQPLVHGTGPDCQRVASGVTITWKIIIPEQTAQDPCHRNTIPFLLRAGDEPAKVQMLDFIS